MKLIIARLREPNFGDELNGWMWPRLLPGFFDDDPSAVFLGIGSIITHRFDGPYAKVVFGAGHVREYGRLPDLAAPDWTFYFVRGPRTAAALGLDPDLAVGDAAILVRTLDDLPPRDPQVASFMPHWESMGWGYWERACEIAGLNLIDPRRPVPQVLREIARSRVVVAEAMHGAIVADSLRVPWVAVRPLDPRHRAKWPDWCEALGLEHAPRPLLPSSPTELVPLLTSRLSWLSAARAAMASPLLWPVREAAIRAAAASLRAAAAAPARLSSDAAIERATQRMLEKLDLLKRHRGEGRYAPPSGAAASG
jgi:succinoglycan biosynthesis protein ExoV